MSLRATPNLPSRDFAATADFYARLGFETRFRSDGWMILGRGDVEVEFFHHPGLDPRSSWFSACLRTLDLDALYAEFRTAGLTDDSRAIPRLTPPVEQPRVPRYFALVDRDGSLWRCLQTA
ncbi:bleomycin resistance protein [Wenxinia marina]|uniref:bleomycin resistance protein n=1 Tax=Wenxinia marina TaxID=390641 RepID=UPI000475ED82|nr:bleomycin resistance protein [Wenxinia marina]GGL57393.1 bleomycin resistance protein [Wenxinia marina]